MKVYICIVCGLDGKVGHFECIYRECEWFGVTGRAL